MQFIGITSTQLREIATWTVVSEIFKHLPESFIVNEMHTSGGQQDNLFLKPCTENLPQIVINRCGILRVGKTIDDLVNFKGINICSELEKKHGLSKLMDRIIKTLGISITDQDNISPPISFLIYSFIAKILRLSCFSNDYWECRNIYYDTSGWGGGKQKYLDEFNIDQNINGSWFILKNKHPIIGLDMTGVVFNTSGKSIDLDKRYSEEKGMWPIIIEISNEYLAESNKAITSNCQQVSTSNIDYKKDLIEFNKKVIRDRLIILKDKYEYKEIKSNAVELLKNYIGKNKIIHFRSKDNSILFKTERIVPNNRHDRPNVLFLFSNPHPHSVEQGMFLSPATNNRPHSFWGYMQKSGWFKIPSNDISPNNLATVFTDNTYESQFNIFFKCFYEFPTKMPDELRRIFGNYFPKLKEDSLRDMKGYVIRKKIDYILVFNGEIFSILTDKNTRGYTKSLNDNKLIQSLFIGNNPKQNEPIPAFLTYPTGFRYDKNRHNSLVNIKTAIETMESDKAEQSR